MIKTICEDYLLVLLNSTRLLPSNQNSEIPKDWKVFYEFNVTSAKYKKVRTA